MAVSSPLYNSRFIWLVAGVAALGGLLFGYDTAIISGAIPLLRGYLGLGDQGLGWAVGCILIGCALGALVAGNLMEQWGRRRVLMGCAALFALSGLGAGISWSLGMFVSFRIAGGLAVGAAAMVSPVYIAEMAPAGQRGRLVSVYQLAIVCGILLAYFVSYLLGGMGAQSWRWMFGSQVLPAVVFLVLLIPVPETPRWLIKWGNEAGALRVLGRIGGADSAAVELMRIRKSFGPDGMAGWRDLSTGRYRSVLFIGIMVAVFQQVTGINAVLYYAPIIFRETGVSGSGALLETVCIGAVNLLATFLAIGFVDRLGRKPFLLGGSLVMGLSLVVIAGCFGFHYFSHYLVLVFTLLYVAAFACSLGAVTWVYLAEIFPNRIRGMALSAATLALWLADFLVTYTFPMLNEKLGTAGVFCAYAICCGASALFAYLVLPETKGKALEQIERSLIK